MVAVQMISAQIGRVTGRAPCNRYSGQLTESDGAMTVSGTVEGTLAFEPRAVTYQVYAKTFRDDRGARIHERFRHFWSLAQRDAQAPAVARPLAWHAHTRAIIDAIHEKILPLKGHVVKNNFTSAEQIRRNKLGV